MKNVTEDSLRENGDWDCVELKLKSTGEIVCINDFDDGGLNVETETGEKYCDYSEVEYL